MVSRVSACIKLTCILLIPLLFAVGCAKRDAQKALDLASQAQQEAASDQAPRFAKESYNDANRTLSEAKRQFEAGDYKESIQSAERAQARFLAAKDAVPAVRERVLAAQTQVEEILARALDNADNARKTLSAEEVNPVAAKLDDLRTKLADEFINEVEQDKWDALIAEAEEAEQESIALATAHLKPQAAEAKQEVLDLLTKAQELKADVHAPDQYATVVSQIKALDTLESDGKWEEVIAEAEKLQEPLDAVIIAAQEKAAADIMKETVAQVEKAKQLGVADAPEFDVAVSQAEQAIQVGKSDLESQDYAGAIAATDDAKAYLEQAYKVLGDKSMQLIEDSKTNLERAVELEIEKYAPSVLSKVQNALTDVENLLANEEYPSAFAAAKLTVDASEKAIDAARSGKARLAMQKVTSPFSVLKSQGGAQYAKGAFDAASSAVADLNEKMNAGEFEAVVEDVPAVVTVIDEAIEELSKSTAAILSRADTALAAAAASDAGEWVPGQFTDAKTAKASAEGDLKNDRFLSAIKKAENVIAVAKSAEAKSYELQTEQNVRKSDDLITEAKRADQHKLSPLAYSTAMRTREDVLALNKEGKNKQAFEKSIDLVKKADRAVNNLVYTAREETDSALVAKAVTFAQPEIQQALALLNEAEEAQTKKNYPVANEKAQLAISLANDAEYFTWKQRSAILVRDLATLKERLDAHLASEKTPALYASALENLAEAKIKQIDADYKESYDYAAKASALQNDIWTTMKQQLSQKSEELTKTAAWLGANVMDDSGRELKVDLIDAVVVLDQQIDLKNWKAAYAAAEEADEVAQKVVGKMQQINRTVMAKNLSSALEPYQEKNALAIVPEEKDLFEETLASFKTKEGDSYTQAYQNYQKSLETIENLPDSISDLSVQRTDEIASILAQCLDANAPKYFKDWYRELSSDLQWLRNSVRGEDYEGIAARLTKLEKDAPALLLATKNAIAEDNYLESLNLSLNQMTNLMTDFGKIIDMPQGQFVASRLTEHKLDQVAISMFKSMQSKFPAKTFRINAEILEDRVKEMVPPKSMEKVHETAIRSFMYFRKAAEGFEIYGDSDANDLYFRERRVKQSYDYLYKTLELNDDLMDAIHNHRKLSKRESFFNNLRRAEEKFGRFYYSYTSR